MTMRPFPILALLCLALAQPLAAESPDALIKRAKLILEDDFNRSEKDDSKEQLGREWVTNSEKRAHGVKQADLKDGNLVITMAAGANHSVSVRHDAPFDDGIVQVRFKLHDAKGIKFNFNDPKANKDSWAGHIARVVVTPKSVSIGDDKKGVFDLKIREQRQNKEISQSDKAKLDAFLKTKTAVFKNPLKENHWYELTIANTGPKFEVYIDKQKVGEFISKGLDHKVKQNLAFGVSGKATIDDLKIWTLNR